MARLVVKIKYQIYTCYDEIELCAQNIDNTPEATMGMNDYQHMIPTQPSCVGDKVIDFMMMHDNCYTHTTFPTLGMVFTAG